ILYLYRVENARGTLIPPLAEARPVKLRRPAFNLAKQGWLPMRPRGPAERAVEPRFASCPVSRTQAQGDGEACLVSRNHRMHDSMRYLRNGLEGETDVLQEYFVPRDRFVEFVYRVRHVLRARDANL